MNKITQDIKELNKIFESLNISDISTNILNDGSMFISMKRDTNKQKVELPEKYKITNKTTTLNWKDGTKTTVKKCEDDEFNPRLAFLTAFFQKYSGLSKNKANKYLSNLEYTETSYIQGKKPKHAKKEGFKIGDRVLSKKFGYGTVIYIETREGQILTLFDKKDWLLHDGHFALKEACENRCWWCLEDEITKI